MQCIFFPLHTSAAHSSVRASEAGGAPCFGLLTAEGVRAAWHSHRAFCFSHQAQQALDDQLALLKWEEARLVTRATDRKLKTGREGGHEGGRS